MKDKDELDSWTALQTFKRLGSREGRYIADVRHPLKPRALDDRPISHRISYRRPHEKSFIPPSSAPCARCKQVVLIEEWYKHPCFGPRGGKF